MHAAWNFTQGGVFGAAVSGDKPEDQLPGLLQPRITGPDWLTGGAFGPEASVVTVVVCTAVGLALLALAIRRGSWVAPSWVRRRRVAEGSVGTSGAITLPNEHLTALPPDSVTTAG
jgi:hypothetical protein